MLEPSIDKLVEKVDSKYSLVVVAAKRARQLLDGEKPRIDPRSNKYVGIALEEIAADAMELPSHSGRRKNDLLPRQREGNSAIRRPVWVAYFFMGGTGCEENGS